MYALDTDSIIFFFKGLGRVAERLAATPPSDVRLPAVVLYELEVGIEVLLPVPRGPKRKKEPCGGTRRRGSCRSVDTMSSFCPTN
jgi:predicted nucleic acid-binding protein